MPTANPIKRNNWIAIVVVVLVLGAVVVVAKTSREPFSDPQFAAKAAQGSLAEVELGQLAAHKGQTETVRAFGQRIRDGLRERERRADRDPTADSEAREHALAHGRSLTACSSARRMKTVDVAPGS